MQKVLIALSLLTAVMLATEAKAGDIFKDVLEGQVITGVVVSPNAPNSYCHQTFSTAKVSGKIEWFVFPMTCKGEIHNYVNIGWPLFGPPINMRGVHEATRVKILPNGHIKLY